jgi:hypothetical protein
VDSSGTDEIAGDIDAWARSHGFEPSDEQIGGATPLLRQGVMDSTADAYAGDVGGRRALLAEFAVGSPDASEMFGGSGVSSTWFTLFLFSVDASRLKRLTIHPTRFTDGDWIGRLLHRDHRVATVRDDFDQRYRAIASGEAPDEQVAAFLDAAFVDWLLAQDELAIDIEHHDEHGGYLVVARSGIGIGDEALDLLQQQAGYVAEHAAAVL